MSLGSRRAMKRRVVGLVYRSSARAASSSSSPAVEAAPRSKPGEPAYLYTLTGSCRPDRASPNVGCHCHCRFRR